jgi:hypothetical protein
LLFAGSFQKEPTDTKYLCKGNNYSKFVDIFTNPHNFKLSTNTTQTFTKPSSKDKMKWWNKSTGH